ncbi:phage tail protein, partial [Siccibacter turicensis]
MTAKYFAILTNQGAARLANATALGTKLNLTQMAVGDANGVLPTPDTAQTKLINQKRIAPLNMLEVDPNNSSQIIAEQIIPESEGGFWIREIGLYDDDGVLIAVANCPETYKPQLQEGSGRTQTIRMVLIVSSTAAITLKIDPAVVLATRKYVDDKVIEVKAYADGLMKKHTDAKNPHTQYPLIANALKEMADAGLVAEVLKNLGLGEGSALPVGVPVPWPLPTAPDGWLKYNGAAFDKAKYP